jgi:hypothetical protein
MRCAVLLLIPFTFSCSPQSQSDANPNSTAGFWESDSEILSLSANGRAIDLSQLPSSFRDQMGKDIGCTTMTFENEADIAEQMKNYNNAKSCNVTKIERNGTRVSIEGSCEAADQGNLKQTVIYSSKVNQLPEQIEVQSSLRIIATNRQTNAGAEMKAEVRTQHRRTGGC